MSENKKRFEFTEGLKKEFSHLKDVLRRKAIEIEELKEFTVKNSKYKIYSEIKKMAQSPLEQVDYNDVVFDPHKGKAAELLQKTGALDIARLFLENKIKFNDVPVNFRWLMMKDNKTLA